MSQRTITCLAAGMGLFVLSSCSDPAPKKQPEQVTERSEQPRDDNRQVAKDGPFGLKMGQSMTELDLVEESTPEPAGVRLLQSVPRPMAELETYAVIAYPKIGICEIRTVSRTFDSDSYGNNVKSAIDGLVDILDAKYGKHNKVDECSDYSCQFFQQNLKSGSQSYSYSWSRSAGSKMPEDIARIEITAMPGEYNDTYFRLDYTSAQEEPCKAAKRKAKSAAL